MAFFDRLNLSLRGILGILAVLILWELMLRVGSSYENLPTPTAIISSWFDLLFLPQYWEEIAHTLFAALLGWTIASLVGVSLGIALGLSNYFYRLSFTSFEVIRPWPGVAFAPIGLLLFGFSLEMELVVIVLPALWPVLMNTLGGIRNIPNCLYDVVHSLQLRSTAKIFKVFVPAATASILVGLRLSLSLCIVMAVVAEMIGNPAGIGYAIIREQQALHPTSMFAYIFTIAVINVLMNYLLGKAVNLVSKGQHSSLSGKGINAS